MFKRCFCLYWESFMVHSVQCPYLSWTIHKPARLNIRMLFEFASDSDSSVYVKFNQNVNKYRDDIAVYLQRGKTPFRTTLQFSWMMVWNIHSTSIIGSYFSNSDLNILVKQRFLKCEYAPCFHHKYLGWFFFQCNINCQMVKLVIKRSSGWETN